MTPDLVKESPLEGKALCLGIAKGLLVEMTPGLLEISIKIAGDHLLHVLHLENTRSLAEDHHMLQTTLNLAGHL